MKNFDDLTRTSPATRLVGNRRAGLASLEMVLVLPFLMMLMGMIIVFGYAASWKLRTETVARDVVWRDRWHRFANVGEHPEEWPFPTAIMSSSGGQPIDSYEGDPALNDPIIAGPIPAISVDENVLDFTRGMLNGHAQVIRQPPLFAGLTVYRFSVNHPILDDRFQYRQMGIWNYSRRIPVIYESGMDSIRESPEIASAVAAIENSDSWPRLEAIDRDSEFIAVWGSAPNFYPRVYWFATTDRDWVTRFRLGPLLRQIQRLPWTMGNATIRLYQSQLEEHPELQETIDAIRSWLDGLRDDGDGGIP